MCLYKRYAKGYLNCVYDMDYNVEVKPEYCYSGLDSSEILDCFSAYRNIFKLIFSKYNSQLVSYQLIVIMNIIRIKFLRGNKKIQKCK